MAVLPFTTHVPKAMLQSRANTGNALSGGAIAGVVLGSLFALCLLLVIFWTCRGSIFIKTQSPPATLTDEIAKGHARSNGVYTTSQGVQSPSPKIQDEARRSEFDPGSRKDIRNLKSYLSYTSSVEPPCLVHTVASKVPSTIHSTLFNSGALSSSVASQNLLPSYLLSPEDVGVLGVAKPVLHTGPIPYGNELPSLAWSNGLEIIDNVPEKAYASPITTEVKYRRISELTDSEPSISSKVTTVTRYNTGYDSIFPISEKSQHSVPEDFSPRSTPDDPTTYESSAASKTREVGVTCYSATDEEIARASSSYRHRSHLAFHGAIPETFMRCPSATTVHTPTLSANIPPSRAHSTDTVSPWDVGYHPNPVIFPHTPASSSHHTLMSNVEKEPTATARLMTTTVSGITAEPCRSKLEMKDVASILVSPAILANSRESEHATKSLDTATLEHSTHTLRSGVSVVAADDSSTVTTTSATPTHSHGIGHAVDDIGSVEPINLVSIVPQKQITSGPSIDSPASLSTTSPSLTDGSITTLPSQASPCSSPRKRSSLTSTRTPHSSSTESGTALTYSCPVCHFSFRTAGQKRNHDNRKHNLRYPCEMCKASFGLRADFKRHEANVHRAAVQIDHTKLFQCPNVGCSAPEKTYARKDNFTRHVGRCKKAVAEGRSLRNACSEKYTGER